MYFRVMGPPRTFNEKIAPVLLQDLARGFQTRHAGDIAMKPLLAAAALVILATTADAQITKPIRWTWIAQSCPTWNCAAAALVMANGEPNVVVLPTGMTETPFVVLRRVEEGSIVIPDDEPFACEVYGDMNAAATSYSAIEGCRVPILFNTPDGMTTLTALTKCGSGGKRRAAH
jgi:hypothetical protein